MTNKKILIANLPLKTTTEELRVFLYPLVRIVGLIELKDSRSKKTKTASFEVNSNEDIHNILKLNGISYWSNKLNVMNDKTKENEKPTQNDKSIPKTNILTYEIPITTILKGNDKYEIDVNGKIINLNIRPGEKEGTKYNIGNNTIIEIKYKKDAFYKRIGNDLIGNFAYPKEYVGKLIQIPYPDDSIEIGQMYIQEGSWEIEKGGFPTVNNHELRGNYKFTVKIV